jgi:hypothetical protein
MLIKITLVLAILASIGTIVVNHLVVAEKTKVVINDRNTYHKNWQDTDRELKKTQGELNATRADLSATSNKLVNTESKLRTETIRANQLERKAGQLEADLAKVTQQRDTAQQELAQYEFIGLKPPQIRSLIEENKDLKKNIVTLEGEKKEVERDLKYALDTIEKLIGKGGEKIPPLPADLRGKVVAVDPKWDFMVVDVGRNQKVIQNGRLLVSRDGKLLAKVKVVGVEDNRSIVNLLPGWKLDEVMEGDVVQSAQQGQ